MHSYRALSCQELERVVMGIEESATRHCITILNIDRIRMQRHDAESDRVRMQDNSLGGLGGAMRTHGKP